MESFLSCVGFTVLKYALKSCKYDTKQFLPACFVGVPLHFLQAQQVGNPSSNKLMFRVIAICIDKHDMLIFRVSSV